MEPVKYIETREYSFSPGYDKPYQWAYHDEAPFTSLNKLLSESRVALVSTKILIIRSNGRA